MATYYGMSVQMTETREGCLLPAASCQLAAECGHIVYIYNRYTLQNK